MKKIILSVLIIFIFFSSAVIARAADISFTAPSSVGVGEQFGVTLGVNTGGASINSIDIGVAYPADILTFKGYQEDGGVVKIWLKPPTDDSGVVSFSGIIPGGVDGSYDPNKKGLGPVPIIKLLFVGKAVGSGSVYVEHSNILINDGLGTELVHDNNSALIAVSDNQTSNANSSAGGSIDTTPPEPFSVSFIKAGFFSSTPPMIMFNATDVDSGIEKYQMNTGHNNWKTVVSPLQVQQGIFSKDITIRAYDYNGNFRDSSLVIPGSSEIVVILIAIVLILLLIMFVRYRFLWYKLNK